MAEKTLNELRKQYKGEGAICGNCYAYHLSKGKKPEQAAKESLTPLSELSLPTNDNKLIGICKICSEPVGIVLTAQEFAYMLNEKNSEADLADLESNFGKLSPLVEKLSGRSSRKK
jgi:hypothetical protein